MKVRSGWGRNFLEKFYTGGAVKGSEPDVNLTPATKISSRHVESAKELVQTAPRCTSERLSQETVDSILSEKSDEQKEDEVGMDTTGAYSLGAEIDIPKILHSMKRRKRSDRPMVKSSEPWAQQLEALNSPKNVARARRNYQGVGSKKMKRSRRGRGCRTPRRATLTAKGKKHSGGEADASNQPIPATEPLSAPKSDTSSELKDSNGPSEISMEQAAILMNNTFLGFTNSKGAAADDLMATTDVISLYQDREKRAKLDPAIIPGLDLSHGAEKFDTSTAESALASLCSLCAVSVPDPCVEFAVKDFSVLSSVVPWEADDIWRIYAGYFFVLHIPLSFGGLGVVAKVLRCSSLDPLTTVISTVLLQLVELSLALALLQYSAMPGNDVQTFFASKVSTRNWVKETVIGFTVLMILVWITSILVDKLVGSEDAYDPILEGILSDSPTSKLLCFFLYCVIAPLSEETIYRGFLLTALSSSMKWRDAVVMSSLAFSVAHLSGESSVQLFVIGCITGLTYCRTGTLVASFTIHSLYNAVTLYMALAS
ncbi:uncharacterized protein C2845_PM03G27860 [Panicum miliaceum]|uniref:CAAX prenyl protease 2/Lysostaphin resistance protein A-like domain-containing protein n=1 Tax=Panicum miliaceum TaxID=4540 RepID=A0A3L6TE74_PANMI|nr:uncharacterized protein C2845_PM03G27860 [Panicum miliaceum]